MGDFKYKAFISYSHKDRKWTRWLHRRLETYPIPKNIIGKTTPAGIIPRRLKPIFRDREELSASNNLGEKIQAALASSKNLIIICSPAAAQSKWVNQEILTFKQNNRDAQLFSVIVEGEPYASTMPGREAEECFPPALRFEVNADGTLSDTPAEPLAADLRPHADGKRLGFLKLLSGMIGVGLDEVVQRDMKRSRKRVTAITTGSLATVLAMGTLTGFALDARAEAEERRVAAEGLIQFMLGDLRDKVEPIGRLDLLDDVANEALHYFRNQQDAIPSCQAISANARAHYVHAKNNFQREEQSQAQADANTAVSILTRHVGRCSDEANFMINYAHAQQWAVETKIRLLQNDDNLLNKDKKEQLFEEIVRAYYSSEETLRALEEMPNQSINYALEMADVDILVGRLTFQLGNEQDASARFYSAFRRLDPYIRNLSLPKNNTLSAKEKRQIKEKYADVLSWIATIQEANKSYEEAKETISRYRSIYDDLSKNEDGLTVNALPRFNVLEADYAASRIWYNMGKTNETVEILHEILPQVQCFTEMDQSNETWRSLDKKVKNTVSRIQNLKE
ncbi:MAG: toll/interleukin-1 receptor domain-containing protein [Hellea sp.]